MKKYLIITLVLLQCIEYLQAQNVGIGTTSPHPSARLDISDSTKGLLIPRMTFQQRNAIASPAKGLLVFVTSDSTFYFFDGAWKPILAVSDGWRMNGNNNIDSSHFIGTVNDQPLRFRVNNIPAGVINLAKQNISFGANNLPLNTAGGANLSIGDNTLRVNTTGGFNIAIGQLALTNNTSGAGNVAIGFGAMGQNKTGDRNMAIGLSAMGSDTSGSANIAMGDRSLGQLRKGDNNIAIGFNTSLGSGEGYNNLLIGTGAFVGGATVPENATVIGSGAIVNGSNKIRLGNSAVTVIEGQVPFSTPSDGRFKTDVKENVSGLDFIMQLRPVTYQFNTKQFDDFLCRGRKKDETFAAKTDYTESQNILHSGFIAQEVEQASKKSGYKFDGLNIPKNENEAYSLSYSQFAVPLVKAVQEQQKEIELLKKQNELLTKEIQSIKQSIKQ